MKAIAKSRKMLVAEFLRRSETSHELPGNNGEIKGRETFSMIMQTIYRKFCFEFSDIKMSFTAFSIQFQAQRHMCQRHAKMFMKATTSNVLPKSLSELTSMSDENIREKLNDMDGTRPIKYKLHMKKDVQYKTTLRANSDRGH